MTLIEAAVKIISTLGAAVLVYVIKNFFKIPLFSTFRRISSGNRSRIFSLLQKSNDRYLDMYAIRSEMLAYGIRYSPQFMKNLFYYTYKKNIRFDNKELSSFLSLPGIFDCKDDGEITVLKGARFLSSFILLAGIIPVAYAAIVLPEVMQSLPCYLVQGQYGLIAFQVVQILVSLFCLGMSMVCIYVIVFRTIPAFRFVRNYKVWWNSRDLFEKGEQNLFCGNKAVK